MVHAVWANVYEPADRLTAIRVRRWHKGFTPQRWRIEDIDEVTTAVQASTREVCACLYGVVSGDFSRTATEDIQYMAFEQVGGDILIMNTLGVPADPADEPESEEEDASG